MAMSIIDAAIKILEESKVPIVSKEIAATAISRGWINSKSANPAQSLANSIDKMIREKTTNKLKHVSIPNDSRKFVALESWDQSEKVETLDNSMEVRVRITEDHLKIVNLLTATRIANTENEALSKVISLGTYHILPEIKDSVNELTSTQTITDNVAPNIRLTCKNDYILKHMEILEVMRQNFRW